MAAPKITTFKREHAIELQAQAADNALCPAPTISLRPRSHALRVRQARVAAGKIISTPDTNRAGENHGSYENTDSIS